MPAVTLSHSVPIWYPTWPKFDFFAEQCDAYNSHSNTRYSCGTHYNCYSAF